MSGPFQAEIGATRRALQWRLLLLWSVLLLTPTAVLALPLWHILSLNLDYSVQAAQLAQALDLSAIDDLGSSLAHHRVGLGSAGLIAVAMTLLPSPLLSGMAASAARSSQAPGFGALAIGGFHNYPRMLRILMVGAIPLGLAAIVGRVAMRLADGFADKAILESDAQLARFAAGLVLALLLLLAHATIDAGRAVLATDSRRSSALSAWFTGCRLLFRNPGPTLRAYLLISVAGLLLATALSVARVHMAPLNAIGVLGALLLTQLTVAVLGWMRTARLFALIELARRD
jgi:hypothetical protein